MNRIDENIDNVEHRQETTSTVEFEFRVEGTPDEESGKGHPVKTNRIHDHRNTVLQRPLFRVQINKSRDKALSSHQTES